MDYTATQTSPGIFQVSQGGKTIGSGTKDYAQGFLDSNPPTPTKPQPSKVSEPTVLTSSNISENKIPDLQNKMATMGQNGMLIGPDGLARYSDSTFATAPAGATQNPDTGAWSSNGVNYAVGPESHLDPDVQGVLNEFNDLKTKMDATSSALIDNIKAQYEGLISQQKAVNTAQEASVETALVRGGTERYSPVSAAGVTATQVSYGLRQIGDLQQKENAAIIAAQQAQQDGDYKLLSQKLSIYDEVRKEKQDAAQKLSDTLTKQGQEQTKLQQAATRDSSITSAIQGGMSDPSAILASLRKAGDTTTTLSDINNVITTLHPDSKAVLDVLKTAADNGATPDILKKIGSSNSLADAYSAAGKFASGGSGVVGEYNRAVASGYKGSLTDYSAAKSYADAYNTAKGKAAGEAAGNPAPTDTSVTTTDGAPIPDGGSILAHTGLSIAAFRYLTEGTPSMSRLSSADRKKIMSEAETWANKNGIDISTFQSQYKGYNDVLSKNINRLNSTKIMENEIDGTLSNLKGVANDADLKKLRSANLVKIFAGQETNDPIAQKYAFHIQQLKNEVAGYFAASQGKASPDVVDNNDAEKAIKDGINQGSIAALEQSVRASTEKMGTVMDNSVSAARKGVWDLFGVGSKFVPTKAQLSPEQVSTNARQKLLDYHDTSRNNASMLDEIHSKFPNMSDVEVAQKLGLIEQPK